MKKKLPNIILIIMDSARSDCFGSYGSDKGLTPNLDELAEESLVCENFYAAGSGSALSHVAIFSGQHSSRTGIVHNLSELKDSIQSIPEILSRKKDYKAYGMAKIIQPPVGYEDEFGFDELVYPRTGSKDKDNVPIRKRMIDQLRKYPRLWTFIKFCFTKTFGTNILLKQTASHFDGKSSLDYLYKKITSNKSNPLFLYSTILHPHTPYCPPDWAVRKVFGNEKVHPLAYEIQTDQHAWLNGNYGDADAAMKDMKKLYDAELLYGDHLVGEFLNKLKSSGEFDESLIIITGDHGEMFGEHGEINHGATVYNEVIKVPLIIKFPGSSIKRKTSKLCSHLDILPTIMNYLKVDISDEDEIDGEDILNDNSGGSLIIDSPPLVLPGRLGHYPSIVARYSVFWRCIIDSSYKYVWRSDGKQYLYERNSYEKKSNNIIQTEESRAKSMKEIMISRYKGFNKSFDMNEYPINIGPKAAQFMTSPRIIRELKKEGYL